MLFTPFFLGCHADSFKIELRKGAAHYTAGVNEKPGAMAGAFSIEPRHFNRKPFVALHARAQ
jgi:hypothetical protein